MTKDGYAQRVSELTALLESTVDDILVDLAETENARQALQERESRADELAHADLVACREQLRQATERADREAAEASSLRDEVDRLTRQRDGWRHLFEAQWQHQKELCDKVDELCAQHDQDAAELSSLRDECDRVARERDEKARAYRLEAEQATATARERRIEKAAQMIHGFDDSLSAARALDAAGLLKDGDE